MSEPFTTFQPLTAMESFAAVQPLATFDQRHLGWKVITLHHFHRFAGPAEADIFSSAVRRASHKPETVQRIAVMSRCSLAMKSEAREENRVGSPTPRMIHLGDCDPRTSKTSVVDQG